VIGFAVAEVIDFVMVKKLELGLQEEWRNGCPMMG